MTGLKESVEKLAGDISIPLGLPGTVQLNESVKVKIEKWVENFIKELEEHMRQWFISDIWEHDERCDADIQSAIGEMLKFLKGEAVK